MPREMSAINSNLRRMVWVSSQLLRGIQFEADFKNTRLKKERKKGTWDMVDGGCGFMTYNGV